MSSSRPLRPRLPSGSSSGSSGSLPRGRLAMRRINRVSQACGTCRMRKLKCDGRRPVCHRCKARNETCEYANDIAGTSLRLETLETLIDNLKSRPPDQAADLLESIRTTDDVATIVIGTDADNSPGMMEPTQGQERLNPSQAAPPQLTINQETPDILAVAARSANLQQNLADLLIPRELPDESATQQAIDAFFTSSTTLFQVFSKGQLDDFVKCAFYGTSLDPNKRMIAMSCFSIVAAIGCQYAAGDLQQEIEDAFYDNAKCSLDSIIEFSGFETIKLCSLLAMYNCMNKGTVALAYTEIGLSLAKMHGLYEKKCPNGALTQAEWSDYRKAWRLLIFFSSWLSATLGYHSENEALLRIPLSAINSDDTQDIEDVVQSEMTKISLLKITILRLHLAFKKITVTVLESVMQDLEKWHGELPSVMKMANLGRGDISVGLRRSIYYTHLLYLGAIILVYQRIAYESYPSLIRVLKNSASVEEPDPLHRLAGHGVLAAKHSARILHLLITDHGVFCRCWLVMFQAYISCVTLLHAVVQDRLHGMPRNVSDHNLELASKCLSVLEYCGKVDQVAAKFHKQLANYYEKALTFNLSKSQTSSEATGSPSLEVPSLMLEEESMYLLQIPPGSDSEQRAVSLELLEILCIPFRDLDSEVNPRTPVEMAGRWPNAAAGFEDSQVPECEVEQEAFLYDAAAKSLIERAMTSNTKLGKGWFVAGREPFGWSQAGFQRTHHE